MKKIVVGITGASGSIYAKVLIEELLKRGIYTHVIFTDNGKKVMQYETSLDIEKWMKLLKEKYNHIKAEDINNLFSGVASGSYKFDAVIVLPCSMGTLAEISNGLSKNLLCRVADVALKENRKLVIVPRETPLNAIHLENMLKLSKLGVTILPAIPGFYHKPETLDDLVNFVVGKILDNLSIENELFKKWEG
ncbi:UbiX family flavin prenyltransferase [Geosporobacter ferrireducens]|uniref:Flavin prenyltransferase UbiX n=1 Tax=Geosporobacter ferrireducens TaxID=1424294 RepID=A0A1D8GFE0_9FIRM|nr:flavin prenyltransferase UbiX [Geosporobacter ferrireducens]AOT69625.1 aromatic acid decarboxylase [Geosporobacter ferrireducens]MTI54673.1 UbiX family flavin prenyltransferase [Geosporobacter ferrireducens]